MNRVYLIAVLVVPSFVGSCRKEKAAVPAAAGQRTDSVRGPEPLPPPAGSVDQLVDSAVPRAVAGQPGWAYQQRVTADLDVDGTMETAVLISDVALDARGRPLWEHGHRWQVYVEEPDGTRTYLYARFLPNGKLTAELTQPQSTSAPTIALLEQSPTNLALYEIAYNGVGKTELATRFERNLRRSTFTGSPHP